MHFLTTLTALTAAVAATPTPHGPLLRREKRTTMTLGGKYIDYGCDASVRKSLGDAFDAQCPKGRSACDDSQTWERDVDWADANTPRHEEPIKVMVEGNYPNDEIRGHIREAVMAAVNPKTSWADEIIYDTLGGGIGQCQMSRFSSFVDITGWDGEDHQWGVNFRVTMEAEQENLCDDVSKLEEIAGSLPGTVGDVASDVFGPFTFMICSITEGSGKE